MHLLIRWKRPYPVSQLCASVAARVQGTKQPICVYIYVWNGRLENSVVYLADYEIVKLVMAYVQHGHGHDHEDGVVLQAKSEVSSSGGGTSALRPARLPSPRPPGGAPAPLWNQRSAAEQATFASKQAPHHRPPAPRGPSPARLPP
jgi:hypothetical protein